jgi:RNA polymerase sigma-70 factor (ECF subfamily)
MQTASIAADIIGLGKRERAISELDDIDALVRTHRARLLRFVTFSVGDDDLAATIVQDCFLKAWANRGNFRGDCSVATWLTSIALNLVRDQQRTRKFQFWRKAAKTATDVMEVASILPGHESSPERQLLAREKAAAVATAIETLSSNQRTVFLMRFGEEMELADIARAMSMPVNTVKTHLHRAVRMVRERVGGAR